MSQVTLRPVTLADVELLTYWDTKPHVVAATGSDDVSDWTTELAGDLDWRDYLIGEEDGRPVGIVQIIDPHREESHYWGEIETGLRALDIWLGEEADLGRGLGTRMMELALTRCFEAPDVTAVVIDPLASNRDAHRFYERLGFTPVGPRRFGEDDCLVLRLERADWQMIEHREVES